MTTKRESVKCNGSACNRTSTDPKADGWRYVESLFLRRGWRCPECWAGLERIAREHGVVREIERLD